jgi:hypothetical protein
MVAIHQNKMQNVKAMTMDDAFTIKMGRRICTNVTSRYIQTAINGLENGRSDLSWFSQAV